MRYNKLQLDSETTGLNENKDCILEIVAITLDKDYKPVNTFHRVIFQNAYDLEKMTPEVVEMHSKNKLLREVVDSKHMLIDVQADFVAFLKEHTEKPQLLGRSVHFDRAFLKVHMPQAHALFSHRNEDLRSILTFLQGLDKPVTLPELGSNHRAMDDCKNDIETFQALRELLAAHD